MTSISYSPLSLPEYYTRWQRIYDFLFTGFSRSIRAKFLTAQMQKRTAISREAWGPNHDRYTFAHRIAEIITEEIEWPNANFIPDDPMHLVLLRLDTDGLFWDHMELECIYRDITEIVGRDLTEEEVQRIYDGTFGEAIDLLLDIQQNIL